MVSIALTFHFIADHINHFLQYVEPSVSLHLGFVRFAHQKSVDRAFDRFKVSEIEVQDVSVMIKSLKPESQPML